MADVEGVGAIGAEGLWRLVPSGGRSCGRILVLYSLIPRLFLHLLTEPRLIKARALMMPFVNTGISKFR